jgi:hypothetical protein
MESNNILKRFDHWFYTCVCVEIVMTKNDKKTTQSKNQRQSKEIMSAFDREMLRQKILERRSPLSRYMAKRR